MVCWELPSVYLHLGTVVVKINRDCELLVNKKIMTNTNETLKPYRMYYAVNGTIKKKEPKDDGLQMTPVPPSTKEIV